MSRRNHRPPQNASRTIRLAILTELDRLLAECLDLEFRGSVHVRVDAASGRLAEPRFTVERYGRGPV